MKAKIPITITIKEYCFNIYVIKCSLSPNKYPAYIKIVFHIPIPIVEYTIKATKFIFITPATIDINVLATGTNLDNIVDTLSYLLIHLYDDFIDFFVLGNFFPIISINGFPNLNPK